MIKAIFRKLNLPYLKKVYDEINRLEKRIVELEKASKPNNNDENWEITFSGTYSTSEQPTKELLQKAWADLTPNNACFQGRPDNNGNTWLMVTFNEPRDINIVKLRPITNEIRGGWSSTYLNGAKIQALKNGNWIDCLTVSGHTDKEHKIINHIINQTAVKAVRVTKNSYMALSYINFD